MIQHLLLVALLGSAALGQDLGVPLSWRKFSNDRPLQERINIAQTGINEILKQLDTGNGEFNGIGFWQSGNVYSVLANQDRLSGTSVNRNTVLNNLNRVFDQTRFDKNQYNDDAMWWALSSVYAFRAYGDRTQIDKAVAVWNNVNRFAITQAHANAGRIPTKNFALRGSCENKSMVGGVFWRPTTDDTAVNSITTTLFLTLSAYLAEITNDAKYRTAAIASANWVRSLQLTGDQIVLDTVHGNDCSRSPADWLFTYNSGKYIEGLAVLASVTGDSQWTTLYTNILAKAVKFRRWQGEDGIIFEGASRDSNDDGVGFKAIFIRGLVEAFERSRSDPLRILVHSYVDVQYNALLDLAKQGNAYSADWRGPPQGFTTWGQLAAIDVLTAAVKAN